MPFMGRVQIHNWKCQNKGFESTATTAISATTVTTATTAMTAVTQETD
jgi:hypothetical protein